MRTAIPFNNYASGQIDRDVKGRFDIPLTLNGAEVSRNFLHTLKGNILYRPGFQFIDDIGYSALYNFEFNTEQSYLLAFTTEVIKFYSYNENNEFVRVIDDNGDDLEVPHPYGDEIFNLHTTQNSDVLYINHIGRQFAEMKLIRKSANNFVLEKTRFTNSSGTTLSDNYDKTRNHGYPAVSAFYENRLDRASSTLNPTFLYGSKGGDYDNITTGTESNDGFKFDLAEANSPALWIESGANSLLIGTAEGVLTVNGGNVTTAITPTDISAKLSCRDGCSQVRPVHKDNFVFYVSKNKRKLYMFEYDTLTEQFKATNLSKANYEITKGGMSKLAIKNDRFDLLFAVCDGKLLSVCFSSDEGVNSWSEWNTNGKVYDILSVTRPDGDNDLFINVERNINGQQKFFLEKLSDIVEFPRHEDYISHNIVENIVEQQKTDDYTYYRMVAEALRECNYLDCSVEYSGLQKNRITFDETNSYLSTQDDIFIPADIGRRIWFKTISGKEYGIFDIVEVINEKTVKVNPYQYSVTSSDEWYLSATVFSGLEHLEGETVGVTVNGGYIGDFVVENGTVDISSANTNKAGTAIIGLKYKGMIKSCNLGLNLSGEGTQTFTNKKNIYKVDFMLNFSCGGKFGDSLYYLDRIQDFNPEGLYDIPALPIDEEIKELFYQGTYDDNKHYYIVQDEPLPLQVSMIVPHYKHVSNI